MKILLQNALHCLYLNKKKQHFNCKIFIHPIIWVQCTQTSQMKALFFFLKWFQLSYLEMLEIHFSVKFKNKPPPHSKDSTHPYLLWFEPYIANTFSRLWQLLVSKCVMAFCLSIQLVYLLEISSELIDHTALLSGWHFGHFPFVKGQRASCFRWDDVQPPRWMKLSS